MTTEKPEIKEKVFTIPKAASSMAVSRGTLWRWVKSGALKTFRTPGGHYRIRESDLKAFLRSRQERQERAGNRSRKKILVVDDDKQSRQIMTRMLSREGMDVKRASGGFEAGMRVVRFQPELVVLDLFMPDLDGFRVCRTIKGDPKTAHIKVLAVTGYDTEDMKQRALKAGADGFMTKPIEKAAFLDIVESMLSEALNRGGE